MASTSLRDTSIVVSLHVSEGPVRESVISTLTPAGIVIGDGTNAEAGLIVVHADVKRQFDLPEQTGPRLPAIVCTPPAGPRAVRKAIERGIDGLVWDTQIQSRLVPTVFAVAAGQLTVPREAWRPSQQEELTNREKQTLALVVMGLSNSEIASKLYLTESTVKSHLSSGFRKLGVRSRAEAARVIADPRGGLGTGILAITPTSSSGPPPRDT